MKKIPYGKQYISKEDIDSVVNALQSDYLTQGPYILEFERKFANYIGSKYAVAVSNGTAALHLSTLALNLKTGEKVITTPITFVASANCIRYCNAEVVFSDIDPNSYLLDFNKVKNLLETSPKGTFSGLICVDFAGRAINLELFKELAQEHGLWIIEDACHSPGGYFINSKNLQENCGNGNYADLAVFSFHPVKHIACGEGGMITTNDENLYNRLIKLRTHGITKINDEFKNSLEIAFGEKQLYEIEKKYPGWYMEMQDLGFNYRLTDFQAALGISQLSRAENGLKRRREIALMYFNSFSNKKWLVSQSGNIIGHAYHLYVIVVEKRNELYEFLRLRNILAQIHYIPTHLMPYYKNLGYNFGDFQNAESYYQGCISLPMYPSLYDDEVEYVIKTVLEFYNE
jgi:UDP-4-amino-4,6-dideoxy-N-acetyl-beta-L-altrosamine transaminase